jgi:AraC family transcriptional regulator of adaptative response / DNA-3-methyladenine glycosylase II
MRENTGMTTTTISAVRTTGIYCRAECTASPLSRNVTLYPTTIAAEAGGYRPCLRCRPDRLPPSSLPGEALVARALRMISDGALDGASEEELGRRLGVSGRHLRRLFQGEAGATPDFIARSRRAHFARRLLDETDLAMPVVASAAGFASVRQMNRMMMETFRFTPTELRAKRRDRDRMVCDGGLRLRVPFSGAPAFDRTLAYLAMRAVPGVEAVDGETYRRTVMACGYPGVIEISRGDRAHLHVTVHLASLTSLIDVVARVRRIAGLDQPAEAERALRRDPMLRALIARAPGLRVPGAWDPFEVSVRVIIGQQVSVRGASTLSGRIARAFGDPVDGIAEMGLSHVFPTAERLAGARIEQLREAGLTHARAETVRAFARAYADGRVALDGSLTLDDVLSRLQAVPGVGAWTAHVIAMRACGHLDAFPSGDLGLRRSATALLGRDGAVTASELEERAESWRPYRAVAAIHLWSVE